MRASGTVKEKSLGKDKMAVQYAFASILKLNVMTRAVHDLLQKQLQHLFQLLPSSTATEVNQAIRATAASQATEVNQ